jgi:hypothetical protein
MFIPGIPYADADPDPRIFLTLDLGWKKIGTCILTQKIVSKLSEM